jgi:cysteine-rich repeat protein
VIPRRLTASLALAAGAGAAVWACGGDDGDAVCGNGVAEPGEQCDDGNTDENDACRSCISFLPPKTTIRWAFNAEAAPGFTTDGCIDVDSTRVRVDLTGPMNVSKDGPCPDRQVVFDDLPPGQYTAQVTPLDVASQSLVSAPASISFMASAEPNTNEQHTVVVPPEAWSRPMTGTFFFLLRWGGMPCPAAAPPVAEQTVTLRIGGVPVTRSTTSTPMYRLDGSQPVPCVMSTQGMAEASTMMPFGHAQIEVVGKDSGGATTFRGMFDTFVGAGGSNPILTFDVPSTIDAGVDAAIDAPTDAPTDAPDPDAAVDAAPDA